MRILVFDLVGHMGHFRKYYTNSTSLTYDFPPRTVVTGIIAAILGMARDSYHDILSSQNCHIAVQILSGWRKTMFGTNYLKVTSRGMDSLMGKEGRTQVEVEFLLPPFGKDALVYRIFVNLTDSELMDRLAQYVSQYRSAYPVYLGVTECPGSIRFVKETVGEVFIPTGDSFIEVSSVVPFSKETVKLDFNSGIRYIFDTVIIDFNNDRVIQKVRNVVYGEQGVPVRIKTSQSVVDVMLDQSQNIVFLE